MGYDNLSHRSILYSYDLRVDLFFFFLLAPTFTVQIVPSEIMFDADIGSSTTCHLHCTQIWSPFMLRTLSKLVSLVEGGGRAGAVWVTGHALPQLRTNHNTYFPWVT